jgi:hypothetical protein
MRERCNSAVGEYHRDRSQDGAMRKVDAVTHAARNAYDGRGEKSTHEVTPKPCEVEY